MLKLILNYRADRCSRLERRLTRLLDEADTGLLRPHWWQMVICVMCLTAGVLTAVAAAQYTFTHKQYT
jgi:hypothetical protein